MSSETHTGPAAVGRTADGRSGDRPTSESARGGGRSMAAEHGATGGRRQEAAAAAEEGGE